MIRMILLTTRMADFYILIKMIYENNIIEFFIFSEESPARGLFA